MVFVAPAARAVPGGYFAVSPEHKEVMAAAKFAAAQKGAKIAHVISAESQVVAGLNYRFKLATEEGDRFRLAKAVVYRDLQGKMSLASWHWLPASKFTVDSFRFIGPKTTRGDVLAKVGPPDADLGSGIYIDWYVLADGTPLLVSSAGKEIGCVRHGKDTLYEKR